MDDIKKYTEANRAAWNEAMPLHQKSNGSKWGENFSIPGYVVFRDPELQKLKELGISGKNIAHLCCNNGIELMSLKNMGADNCVGFDISEEAILEAESRTKSSGIECTFICCDIYDIPSDYAGMFDIVYISAGCLGWMPNLDMFFEKAGKLLKRAGVVFIYEIHPVSEMLPCDSDANLDPLKIFESYFKDEPYVENTGLDYVGKQSYDAKTQYWFVWTISDILTGLISRSLSIRQFTEYSHDISANHRRNQDAGIGIPLSYILIAEKS